MNTQMIIIGLIALFVLGGGGYVLTHKDMGDAMTENGAMMNDSDSTTDNSMMQDENAHDDTMMEEDASSSDSMMEDESMHDDTMMEGDSAMAESGSYEAYAPEKLARAEDGKVVLFFRASWCPTCHALDADIHAHESDIPKDVTILDVDYDNSAALKQKYGITYQHTLVQVDAKGNQIAKWNGSPTLAALVDSIK